MATRSEITEALEAARRASEPGPTGTFVERLVERIGAKASARAIFGEPIERDGLTVIPVARVRWGFGGGAGPFPLGQGPEVEGREPSPAADADRPGLGVDEPGSGGGGAVTADPVGWIEIGPDGAEFRPIVPAMPSPGFLLAAGATAALVLRALARLLRG
jgi:uncharacterized spore protein YtfJ